MLHQWFPCGHLLLSYLTIYTLPFHISFTTLTMEKEQHIRVCNPLLQVDCEGPTLISYIVAKHLAHASRGTISHHRTCGSAYGGSLSYVQSDIVVHQTRIACDAEFIVGRSVVHYTFRICPISLAAVAIDSCPIWLDATSYEILHPCLRSLPTFPYAHTYPSAKPLVNAHQRCFRICIFEV